MILKFVEIYYNHHRNMNFEKLLRSEISGWHGSELYNLRGNSD